MNMKEDIYIYKSWTKSLCKNCQDKLYCDVTVTQINYPSLKHNTQDSIEQVRGWSHEEGLVQIFMLYVMQFRGGRVDL